MDILEIMKCKEGYYSNHTDMPGHLQAAAKKLCWEYNQTAPVHIGANAFIAPGVCLACAGHAIVPEQRSAGIGTSKPIVIEDDVWIGANTVVCGGVTIGKGSVIGAGSVVNKDIPAGVVAVGNPCKVLRPITEEDRVTPLSI